MEFLPGDDVGPFRIEEVVGRGGSATVYRANDPRFGGPVAVKVLASHLVQDGEAVEQFVREARALRRIDHRDLLSVFDISSTGDGRPYMVLRYADRGTLLDRLPANPGRNHELTVLVDFLASSLGALHKQDLVHRDVKPSNVLIATSPEPNSQTELGSFLGVDERLLLGDLGLVKDLSTGQVTRGAGSNGYAAPEQRAVVSRVDKRTDVFGASAVLTEVALGRVRRPDESWLDALVDLQQERPELVDVLRVGLADDPADRFDDIAGWAASALEALGAPSVRKGFHSREETRSRQRMTALVAAVVGALAVFGFVVWQAGLSGGTSQSDEVAGIAMEATRDSGNAGGAAEDVDAGDSLATELPSTATATPTATPTSVGTPAASDPSETTLTETPTPGADQTSQSDDSQESSPTAEGSRTSTSEAPTPTLTPEPTPTSEAPTPTLTPEPTPTSEAPTPTPTPASCPDERTGSALFAVADVTDTSITLEYEPSSEVNSFFVDGRYVDSARKQSNRHVIEQLLANQSYSVSFASSGEDLAAATTVCVRTPAQATNQPPIGVLMPTNLEVVDSGPSWATLQWVPPQTGGDAYTLFRGTLSVGKNFPDIIGESGKSFGATTHTFEDLIPGETVVLAIRTRQGENQSLLAWIEYTLTG